VDAHGGGDAAQTPGRAVCFERDVGNGQGAHGAPFRLGIRLGRAEEVERQSKGDDVSMVVKNQIG
jgi:hypothetical protein